jgi:hypothetical protein
MKRLLNVLGALVSDLTQNELAARGACRCHKFRSGGFGMELHTYGQALWNAKNITGSACVAVSRNWIWDPDETLFDLPRDRRGTTASRATTRWSRSCWPCRPTPS